MEIDEKVQLLENACRAKIQIKTEPIDRILKCLQSGAEKTELKQALDEMSYMIYKQKLIHNMNNQECLKLGAELLSIDSEIIEADKSIINLKQELEIAKENAKQRKAYDLIANQILSVPSRKKTSVLLEKVEAQISEKKEHLNLLNEDIEKRKVLVQGLIDHILELQKQIRTENDLEDKELGELDC